jgi:hypothetical protein
MESITQLAYHRREENAKNFATRTGQEKRPDRLDPGGCKVQLKTIPFK